MGDIFKWWVFFEIIGWITFPLCFTLFKNLYTKGYSFSKITGLLIWGYVYWIGNTFGLIGNTRLGAFFVLIIFPILFFLTKGIILTKPSHLVTIDRKQINNLQDLSTSIKGGLFKYTQLSEGVFEADLLRADLGRGTIDYTHTNTALLADGTYPSDAITIVILLEADNDITYGGANIRVNDFGIIKENSKEIASVVPNAKRITFSMQRSDLENLGVKEKFDESILYQDQTPSHLYLASVFRSVVSELLLSTEENPVNLNADHLYNYLIETTAYMLTEGMDNESLLQEDYFQAAEKISHFLYNHIEDDIQMVDLCREAHMSERTLQRVCQKIFNKTPRELIKVHRLNAIKKILESTVDESINLLHLSMDFGFMHQGRFAGEYKKLFGESPSQTLRHHL